MNVGKNDAVLFLFMLQDSVTFKCNVYEKNTESRNSLSKIKSLFLERILSRFNPKHLSNPKLPRKKPQVLKIACL